MLRGCYGAFSCLDTTVDVAACSRHNAGRYYAFPSCGVFELGPLCVNTETIGYVPTRVSLCALLRV